MELDLEELLRVERSRRHEPSLDKSKPRVAAALERYAGANVWVTPMGSAKSNYVSKNKRCALVAANAFLFVLASTLVVLPGAHANVVETKACVSPNPSDVDFTETAAKAKSVACGKDPFRR